MDNRTNTIAGWVLGTAGIALGLSIASGMYFHSGTPAKMGYPVQGDEASGSGEAAVAPIATRLASADVAAGQASMAKCAACHTWNQGGANGTGPNLYATVGEPIGQGKNGYAFSSVLSGHGGAWTFDNLDAWLTSPRAFAPGTKMTFAGLSNPQERANVIAFLNAQGSNVPLPAAPAAGAGQAATASGSGSNAVGEAGPAENRTVSGGHSTPSTPNLANAAAPASGAPSIDPAAAVRGAQVNGH